MSLKYPVPDPVASSVNQEYLEILEKTNQQLGLWTNPYGVAVGILSVLVAVIAIAVAIALYKQGKDYALKLEDERRLQQKRFEEVLDTYDRIIQERQRQGQEAQEKIDKMVVQYELEAKTANEDGKVRIQKAIDSLRSERAKVELSVGPLSVRAPSITTISSPVLTVTDGKAIFSPNYYHQCSQCKFGFSYSPPLSLVASAIVGNMVECPKCGNKDRV